MNRDINKLMDKYHPGSTHHLVEAYNRMMLRIGEAIENAEAAAGPSFKKALQMAQEQAIKLGEITATEADEISDYIKRDINDASEYLMETSSEFGDWLMLDIEVIERKVLDLILSIADQTRLELEQFSDRNKALSVYYAGEITMPGTLQCTSCKKMVQFRTTSHIEPCDDCEGKEFQRPETGKRDLTP